MAAPDRIQSLAYSPDGSLVALGTDNGLVRLWTVPARDPGRR